MIVTPKETPEEVVDIDQTQFGSERPLFEDSTLPVDPKATPVPVDPAKAKRKRLLMVGGGVAGAIVLLVLLLVLFMPRKGGTIKPQKVTSSSPVPAELTEQQKRVKELGEDLKAADPIKVDLPFPPVNMNLGLDDPNKRSNE